LLERGCGSHARSGWREGAGGRGRGALRKADGVQKITNKYDEASNWKEK